MTNKKCIIASLVLGCASSSYLHASMGNIATTFGLLPSDIATSQSYSLFNNQISAAYYNPAALAQGSKGQLTFELLQATPELKIKSLGGDNPPVRTGNVLESTQTETVLIGLKTNLTNLTKFKKPVYLALIAGVESYGAEMLSFKSGSSREGQFFQYGKKPLFLAGSIGGSVIDGIDVGVGVRISLHAAADMTLHTDLAGNTSNEQLDVSAEPVLAPLIGTMFDLGKLFCSDESEGCVLDGLDVALSYRGESNTQTKVNASAIIPGTIADPGLPLIVRSLDAFQPTIISIGGRYQFAPKLSLAATLEYQNWEKLSDEFTNDSIKDQANISFKDIIIPRAGAQYKYNEGLTLLAGISYDESPLESASSIDVNLFDNDRLTISTGFSQIYSNTKILAFPLRVDAAYQYQHLVKREFSLSDINQTNYETIEASGDAHVLSFSLSVMY